MDTYWLNLLEGLRNGDFMSQKYDVLTEGVAMEGRVEKPKADEYTNIPQQAQPDNKKYDFGKPYQDKVFGGNIFDDNTNQALNRSTSKQTLTPVANAASDNILSGVDISGLSKGTQQASDINPNQAQGTGETRAGANWQKGASAVGMAAEIGKNVIKLDDNQAKYGTQSSQSGQIMSSVSGSNPVFKAAVSVGQLGSKAFESSIDYDDYGRTQKKDEYKQIGSAVFTPDKTYGSIKKNLERTGGNKFSKEAIFSLVNPVYAGKYNRDLQNATGDWMAEADANYNKRLDLYKEKQDRLAQSKDRYRRTIMDANNIYGNSGVVRVALRGGILNFKTYEGQFDNIKIKKNIKSNYYNVPNNIKALKKGGSIIPSGVLHNEKNNIGDKGLPLVYNGVKVMEIERSELVLDFEPTHKINDLREKYNKTKDRSLLREIGQIMALEIRDNTYSFDNQYKCLNDNSCSL